MLKTRFLFPLALLLIVLACAACPGLGVKYKTSGTYVDGAGGQHVWSINDAHTLIWDDRPYVPVGGVLRSRCISLGPTEENYQADVKALDLAKSKGITDIILKGSSPASLTEPAAWQRMIDYLDTNGFTYGIELDDGPKEALKGYLISPNLYRLEGPYSETTIACNWPQVDSAIYVVARKADNSIKTTGGAIVKEGKVTISLSEPLGSGEVLIVYPRKAYKPVAEGGAPDLWSGYGEYRDRLTAFLKKIKLGPGMRFFLEPFTSKMDLTGDMVGFVPDSQGFRLGLEAYLTKKHVHEGALNGAWGFNDNISSIEEAARLIPLWSQGRGLTYAYDRASAKMYSIDATSSRIWRDIVDYRDSSVQEYMNTIADTLRQQVANVPVIFKCSKYHRIYANPYGMGGYDGLGAVARGTEEASVTDVVGEVYSLAEESAKTTWFVVPGTDGSAGGETPIGYPSESVLAASLDSFREIGCKGFFVDGLEAGSPPYEGRAGAGGGPASAGRLDCLKTFKDKLLGPAGYASEPKPSPEAYPRLADFKPNVISYPVTPTTGAHVKRLAPDTWWLPTLRIGTSTYIGDGMSAYSLLGEDKTYMWSSIGPKTITLKAGPTGFPSVEFPEGSGISKKRGGQFSVTLTDTPTVLRGLDITLVFPYETADTEIERLSEAIVEADRAGLDVRDARVGLDGAKRVMKKGSPLTAYGMAQQSLLELLTGLGADVWLEGEASPANNFGGACPMPGASNNLALVLDTDEEPPLAPYTASFVFDAPSNSSYEIWLAGTPPSEGSRMSYTVENSGWTPVVASREPGAESAEPGAASAEGVQAYAKGLAWYKIGTANLMPGRHTIQFRADSRRASDSRYYFAIDAVVLSPRGFKPNGVVKPF